MVKRSRAGSSPAKSAAAIIPAAPILLPEMPRYHSTGDVRGPSPVNIGNNQIRSSMLRRLSSIGWGTSVTTLIIIVTSITWNLFLIVLNMSPNATADFIMHTSSIDNGRFWQFSESSATIRGVSAALLVIIVTIYLHLLLLVLAGPRRARSTYDSRVRLRQLLRSAGTVARLASGGSLRAKLPARMFQGRQSISSLYADLIFTNGKYRKVWNVVLELPEITLQVLSLRSYMRHGLDDNLLYLYAIFMAINAFLVVYHVLVAWRQDVFHQILHDAIFDTVFAVLFPAVVLVFSIATFHGDLQTVKIVQQFFPPQKYERLGRIYVDSKQINTFSAGYSSLQFIDSRSIFLQIGFNIMSCLRWRRIIHVLLERIRVPAKKRSKASSITPTLDQIPASQSPVLNAVTNGDTKPKRVVPAFIGVAFLIFGVTCIVSTTVSIRSARTACNAYPACQLVSYVWPPIGAPRSDEDNTLLCNCLAFADRDLAPNANQEMPDVTRDLAQVAQAGSLESIQLVNRRLNITLPDEVAKCTNLRSLVLIYTEIQLLPSWSSDTFAQLEYLHIQGSLSEHVQDLLSGWSIKNNLIALPDDFFNNMVRLTTLHIDSHGFLKELPPLSKLPRLETIYLGKLPLLERLPTFGDLPQLQVAAFEDIPLARALPDLSIYHSTLQTIVVQDSGVCCSGYLSEGICNTSFPTCCSGILGSSMTTAIRTGSSSSEQDIFNTITNIQRRLLASTSVCFDMPEESSLLPSSEALEFLEKLVSKRDSDFCNSSRSVCLSESLHQNNFSTRIADACEGVMFRQCISKAHGEGICFNLDFGPVKCVYMQSIIDMRKTSIAAGRSCNPEEEQWLGCK